MRKSAQDLCRGQFLRSSAVLMIVTPGMWDHGHLVPPPVVSEYSPGQSGADNWQETLDQG